MARRAARAIALEAVVGAIAIALWSAGRVLPSPSLTSWSGAARWYASVGPEVAVASLVRVGALGVAVWLVVATAFQLLAGVGAPAAVRSAADLIAPRSLQRFVHGLAGFSLSAGLAVAVPSAGIPSLDPADGAVLHLIAEPPPGTATLRLAPANAPAIAPAVAPPATPVPVTPAAPPAPPAASMADTFVVEPGDSLWSIAVDALVDANQGQPDDGAVERYWRRLIEANRHALVDPGNPDLIYAGQVLVLPAP